MRYRVTAAARTDGDVTHQAYTLSSEEGAAAEVWPALGCNTVRWQVPAATGPRDLLYAPPAAELFGRPTRGGVPVLFPFPNRIRGGQFSIGGREYHLPPNDPAQANAIHGFTPRLGWRVVEHAADHAGACVRAEFASGGATDGRDNWPAAYRIALTIRLVRSGLRFESTVTNPDTRPLPFGLGYHPYFVATPDCRIQTPARTRWVLRDNLPTGDRETL